jgi:hypothetical protein
MNGKMIRKITVTIVMVFGVLFCVGLWIGFSQEPTMIVPAVGFTGVYLWFIAMEVWGVLTGNKKTLSTRLTNWVENHKVFGTLTLMCFLISMVALYIHFQWWGN